MEFNNNKINKNKFRSKSLASNFLSNYRTEKRFSNKLSSISKRTPAFNERSNIYRLTSKSMPIDISNNDELIKFKNSSNTNQLNKSQEISMTNIKDRNDVNVNCTNINISIVNPNFSINNFEPRHSASNINNKNINVNIINNSLLSFNENNEKIEIEKNISKMRTERDKAQILTSIYKDYLENKSQDESFSFNFGDETLKKKFKKYLTTNKIVQHEFKTKSIISGFSAYMYQNEEEVNKDKICLNINIDKSNININEQDESEINLSSHIINFFSLFSGGKDDNNDELPEILKNKLKNMILNNKNIINCPEAAIKKGLFNIELDYINYFMEEKIDETKNFFTVPNENLNKIPFCSIMVLLNIDDTFYIGNIGKIITILSSNYSQSINYLAKEHIFQSQFLDDSYEKNNINEINNIVEMSNNIVMDKSYSSLLSQNIYNQIFPQLNITRAFPGNALYRIIERKYNLIGMNNILISRKEIYDKYKRRSSSTIINLINVLNNQRGKKGDINNNIKESFLLKNNNNLIINPTESIPEKKMISSYPDVLSYKYQKNHDFILICSKVILDNINYEKICKGVYETMKKCIRKKRSFEIFLGCVVKDIIKQSISLGITSNISCIFICFESIKSLYLKYDINSIENEIVSFYLTSNHEKKFELYENLLSADLIDIDKACKYENKLKSEYNKLFKRKKSILSAINMGSDKNKIFYNNFINANNNQTTDINIKSENKKNKKKCRCHCTII
jgi:hypothetical protein